MFIVSMLEGNFEMFVYIVPDYDHFPHYTRVTFTFTTIKL